MHEKTYASNLFVETIWPQIGLAREITLVLIGSWLIALLSQMEIPLYPVPITAQTLGVLLTAALLGSHRGTFAVLSYLGQGALGLPFFAGGTAGFTRLTGPTGGYLVGFVVAAYVVGWLSERGWDRRFATAAVAMLIGNVIIYAFGLPWLANFVEWETVLKVGLFPFILGDLLKVCWAALALSGIWAAGAFFRHRGLW